LVYHLRHLLWNTLSSLAGAQVLLTSQAAAVLGDIELQQDLLLTHQLITQ
jgi:hypothetical protein